LFIYNISTFKIRCKDNTFFLINKKGQIQAKYYFNVPVSDGCMPTGKSLTQLNVPDNYTRLPKLFTFFLYF